MPAAPDLIEPVIETAIVPAPVRLRLPTRFAIDGSIKANPLRQIAFKAGFYEGILQPIEIKRLSAFRFALAEGGSILIVTKKTVTDVGDEPLLLVPYAETVESIQGESPHLDFDNIHA